MVELAIPWFEVFPGTILSVAALAKMNLSLGLEYFCRAARGDHDLQFMNVSQAI